MDKRILFVVSTLNTGGSQRAFANMSLGLPDGWKATFLLNDAENISYEYAGDIISLGLPDQKDKTKIIYQLKVFIKRFKVLKKLKKTGEYVACISALSSANTVNILTGNKYCKVIVSFRSFVSGYLKKHKLKSELEKMAIIGLTNRADRVVALSETMRRDLILNYKVDSSKMITIYNSYPIQRINDLSNEKLPEDHEKWFKDGKKVIISVGRLGPSKNHVSLIRAFEKTYRKNDGIRLIILGEGELRDKLEGIIKELQMENNIILLGFQSNPYKYVKKSDIFVMSSINEGFPNALAESLCLGVPVISADFDSGAREILAPKTDINYKTEGKYEKEEYGILCPVDDVEFLAEAIQRLVEDDGLRAYYSKKAVERGNQFSLQCIIKNWIELVES